MELQKCPPLPPILNLKTHAKGVHSGAKIKPDYCQNSCPRSSVGAGFVPDLVPVAPKIAILLAKPESDDVVNFEAATGPRGRFLCNVLLREAGLSRDDVLIANTLRCSSWQYPTGADAKRAESACRNFDTYTGAGGKIVKLPESLEAWSPNVFIPTFDVGKTLEIGAFYALALEDIRKAIRFANSGYRPLLLFGSEPTFFLAPWLEGKGGIKNWRGHWWEGDWRFTVREADNRGLSTFEPVIPTYRRKVVGRRKFSGKKKKPLVQMGLDFPEPE